MRPFYVLRRWTSRGPAEVVEYYATARPWLLEGRVISGKYDGARVFTGRAFLAEALRDGSYRLVSMPTA